MFKVYIPSQRVKELRAKPRELLKIATASKCKITPEGDSVIDITGEPFDEYNAKNVLYAYGGGFDVDTALLLLGDNYYFDSIDLEQLFDNKKRIQDVKARIIGVGGKTKRYIESVSNARVSVYGNTVNVIGDIKQVGEADTAIKALINGSGHKRAYSRMEAKHRKHKQEAKGF